MHGFLRSDGRKGIRNYVVVAYLVECAHHVAREITLPFREHGAHLVGFPGCYPNAYADRIMRRICTHPNVGAVLLVSLGCESFNRDGLAQIVRQSGRQSETLVIQQTGGTRSTIRDGRAWVEQALKQLQDTTRCEIAVPDLVVGTICGGSDATSGLTANPVIGKAFDWLVDHGAAAIFEETNELVGCEEHLASRAVTAELGRELFDAVVKAEIYHRVLGHGSFAPGNAEGGLTTQEEKSLGAYAKSGSRPVAGMLKPGDLPPHGGLYLLDVVPDGEVRFGFPNISDNAEAVELIACGAHDPFFHGARLGGRLGRLAHDQDLRQSGDVSPIERGHGRRRRTDSGGPGHAGRGGPRGCRLHAPYGRRRAHRIGVVGPPGVHSHLQEF